MKSIISELPEQEQFMQGERTIEIGYPWITIGAIHTLETILTKEFTVLECGAGGSTVFYAKRCKSVVALETDSEWAGKVKSLGLPNVEIHALGGTQAFLEKMSSYPNDSFSLISVDSNPIQTDRLPLLEVARDKVMRGGWIVLDNYWSFRLPEFDSTGLEVYTFDEIGWAGNGTRIFRSL